MTHRNEGQSVMKSWRAPAVVTLMLATIACSNATSPLSSSSSHWLGCETDADCAPAGPSASCASDGYCVDTAGVRARLDTTRGDPNETCSGAACAACPAPSSNSDFSCSPDPLWARDPETGLCCQYGDLCEAPAGWSHFESEEECLTSCRCAEVDYGNPARPFDIERISLACGCAQADCAMNLPDFLDRVCDDPIRGRWLRTEGCGMVQISQEGGFVGGGSVFDAATGALLGTFSYSDTTYPPCETFSTVAGIPFECEAVTQCELCGTGFGEAMPPCE